MGLKEEFVKLTNEVKEIVSTVKNQATVWKNSVDAQVQRLEDWKFNVITKTNVPTSEEYMPIVKFNSRGLVSSFRMVISGTVGNFVYGGVFDILSSHNGKFEIQNTVSSAYGEINLRVNFDMHGNGYIELKRNTGSTGVLNMNVVLVPYVGSAKIFTDEVPVLDNISEYTFI